MKTWKPGTKVITKMGTIETVKIQHGTVMVLTEESGHFWHRASTLRPYLTPAEKGERIEKALARLDKATDAYRMAVSDYCEADDLEKADRKVRSTARRLDAAIDAYEAATAA